MAPSQIVRRPGFLDLFLAKQRHKAARKLIKRAKKSGRILDIGSGSYPLFLIALDFSEKYGLDQVAQEDVSDEIKKQGISLVNQEVGKEKNLPFSSDYFDVVTLLAVFEHIEPSKLVEIHKEIYRILKPGGIYVMTTPAFWTEHLLRFLARIHLISDVEVEEHKDNYSHSMISSVLQEANFDKNKLRFGYFELFMNTWTMARK
jgi:ubiquinone/menaquinone biosynthesis C-methylase UbiE